jgi:hypothetical protein
MTTRFIEYQLDEETTILVQAPEDVEQGVVKAAANAQEKVSRSSKTFQQALAPFHKAATWMLEELKDLRADEVELKFGLVTTGEVGNFAIGKVGVEANYEVTLKWKKAENQPKPVQAK